MLNTMHYFCVFYSSWHIIYMGNNSNIVFLEKKNNKWVQKNSDIPQNWFLKVSKKSCFSINQKSLNFHKIENRIIHYCREKEISIQIKSKTFHFNLQ